MERRPAVGSKCGVGILHVCQVKDHHQERSDNNIDCSPSHLAHYIEKTVTVRFILDHPVLSYYSTSCFRQLTCIGSRPRPAVKVGLYEMWDLMLAYARSFARHVV